MPPISRLNLVSYIDWNSCGLHSLYLALNTSCLYHSKPARTVESVFVLFRSILEHLFRDMFQEQLL